MSQGGNGSAVYAQINAMILLASGLHTKATALAMSPDSPILPVESTVKTYLSARAA